MLIADSGVCYIANWVLTPRTFCTLHSVPCELKVGALSLENWSKDMESVLSPEANDSFETAHVRAVEEGYNSGKSSERAPRYISVGVIKTF